jgi:DNA-directed RNA polymerase sigma subunit (sigma70/sigma32)
MARPPHLFDDLDPLERRVIDSRFGLEGQPVRSMKQLHADLGVPRADLRQALGSGLAKLRNHLI